MDSSLTGVDDIIMNAYRNNVGGSDAQDVRREIFHDLLSTLGNGLNRPSHLDQARSPGRYDIVNDKSYAPMAQRIAVLLGRDDIVPTDIDGIVVGIVAKANRYYVQISLRIDGRQPAEALALQIGYFCRGKSAHVSSFSKGFL
jgi:hypothetical protein